MPDWLSSLLDLVTPERVVPFVRAAIILVAGVALARLLSRRLGRIPARKLQVQQMLLLRRLVSWGVVLFAAAWALREMGFELTALLGAAGLLTVALGFASQTSVSNVISGLFLMGERPFVPGDVIRMDTVTGEVLSIDLLSVRIRTFDNLMVRVPNETVLKSNVTNLTHFPIRRVDLQVGVAYKEDLDRVREVLLAVADANPLCLEEPRPLILFQGFGDSSIDLQLSVWAQRESWLDLKNAIFQEVKQAFDAEGIEIPFPHRSLYAGSVSAPLPVRLVEPSSEAPGSASAGEPPPPGTEEDAGG